jgi:hypothetical protein
MTILQGELNLLLVLGWDLVVTINQVRVAFSGLFQVFDLLRCDTSPMAISTFVSIRRKEPTNACTASSDDP